VDCKDAGVWMFGGSEEDLWNHRLTLMNTDVGKGKDEDEGKDQDEEKEKSEEKDLIRRARRKAGGDGGGGATTFQSDVCGLELAGG